MLFSVWPPESPHVPGTEATAGSEATATQRAWAPESCVPEPSTPHLAPHDGHVE